MKKVQPEEEIHCRHCQVIISGEDHQQSDQSNDYDNTDDYHTDIESGLRNNTTMYLANNSKYIIQIAMKSVALAVVTLVALTGVFHVFTSYEIMTPLRQLDEQGGRLLAATLQEMEELTTQP